MDTQQKKNKIPVHLAVGGQSIKNKKASGPEGIPAELLKFGRAKLKAYKGTVYQIY